MQPVLFSISSFHLSSFGVFLSLATIISIFTLWRIARTYDLNQDKIFDLSILVFLVGLLSSRIIFVLLNLNQFHDWSESILFYKHPGLSLWGGLIGGGVSLYFLTKKFRLSFWQIADFAAVALLLGLIIGDIGCFLSGCGYGVTSNSIISTSVVGAVGKRLPIQLIEAVLLLILFRSLYKSCLRFHFTGKILALFLIYFGVIKFVTEFYKDGSSDKLYQTITLGTILAFFSLITGLVIYYKKAKKSFIQDLRFLVSVVFNSRQRNIILLKIRRSLFNHKINLRIKLSNVVQVFRITPRTLRRRLNVKPTPKNLI